jgi:hypothetical protein
MTCSGAYAAGWQYAAFFCLGSLLKGEHGGAGPGDAALSDAGVNFLNAGVKPNVGMVLYNLTAGTDGPVTAATEHTLTATGVTWDPLDVYRIVMITAAQRSTIEHYLDVTAGDIHAARAASGGCDCTLASWAHEHLEKLNIIEAGIFHECPCGDPKITDEQRRLYQEFITDQLAQIRDGRIELCEGATGSEFPAIGIAEQTVTEFNQALIIVNAGQRSP